MSNREFSPRCALAILIGDPPPARRLGSLGEGAPPARPIHYKVPGIAETLDWAAALAGLDVKSLRDDPALVQSSLICLLKTEADAKAVPSEVTSRLIGQVA